MRLKILGFVSVFLFLFLSSGADFINSRAGVIIQEDPAIATQKSKQKLSLKDIVSIATALADYITDHGIAPEQDGTYDENIEFCKALAPFYIRNLPVYDGWGNPYRVYCGEACNSTYRGITGCNSRDFIVVSYGRDGKKEDWEYDPNNPASGLYDLVTLDDFDKDIVMWNGSFVRAPRPRR